MGGFIGTYDAKQNIIVVGGVPIIGYADGTYITVEIEEDSFSKTVGADGYVARSKSNNNSADITITLLQSSPSNDYLSALYNLDRYGNLGIVDILVKDLMGTTLFYSEHCWVKKPAAIENSKEIGERSWNMSTADSTYFVGGSLLPNAAVVL